MAGQIDACRVRSGSSGSGAAGAAMSSTGTMIDRSSGRGAGASAMATGRRLPDVIDDGSAAEEGGDRREGTLGGRQADPLRASSGRPRAMLG